MTGRKKGNKGRERVQVHATLTFQQTDHDPSRKDAAEEDKDRDNKDRPKGPKVITGERVSFVEHAIKIMDQMMKEKSVGEVLKLGPREEMLGLTPLSMAAAIGHVEGTRKLLEAGAAVEDKSSDGSTALLNAAHWRHLPVLDLLLQHGASVTAVNNEGNNALMVALRHGDVRAVNSLWPHRKNLDINQANNDGCTAIHLAADRKWESCVQFLIQNGADVNKQNNSGQTALHVAAAKGDHPTSERLLSAGASLLLEDHCGNNPFCLAVRGMHDFLAGYFLSKLKPEDKLYFCKRRVHRVQSQLSAESFSAWNALSFLTSDPSLRDSLYQCDVMTASVQVLGRRGLALEVAVQCCLVCCDLMYNPFPIPDERFVKQFLAARGPEAVLERLDNRGVAEHAHSLEGREVGHLQGHVQGQLQTRQQQLDFNTAFILLPIMAMAETPLGRSWFAEASNQQRLAAHLRRLTSYRELLQLVSLVQQDVCMRERVRPDCVAKLDRVAIVERFVAFFKTLESKDHEEKVRELLELEEREKSRKEKKREKKRQQRLKQKMKTRAGEAPDDPVAKDGGSAGSDVPKTKSQPLDALDDIPLTVGPDGVQDVPDPPVPALPQRGAQEGPGGEDEWVMVGGKRCYQAKVRTAPALSCPEATREVDPLRSLVEEPRPAAVHAESKPSGLSDEGFGPAVSPSAAQAGFLNDYSGLESGGLRRQTPPSDSGAKGGKGSMRWADIARNGNTLIQPEDSAVASAPQSAQPAPAEKRSNVKFTHKVKETYHEQFPSLAQPVSADDPGGQQQTTPNDAQAGSQNFDFLGATHQFLEELCNSGGFAERAPRGAGGCSGQSATSQAAPNPRLDPSILYEALTGWMWQAAVAQGLITPDTDPPLGFPPVEILSPLASQFLKPRATAGKQQPSPGGNQAGGPSSASRSTSLTSIGSVGNAQQQQQPAQAGKNEANIFAAQLPASATGHGSTSIKDWFDMTSVDIENFFAHKRQSSSTLEAAERGPVVDSQRGTPRASVGHSATVSASTHTLPPDSQYLSETAPCPEAKATGSETAGVGRSAEDPFLWAGSGFTDWLPSYPSSVLPGGSSSSSRVSGKPVLDSNDLYGLPLTSNLENPRTLEFPVHQAGSAQRTSSQRDCLESASASKQKHPDSFEERVKDEKPLDVAAEHFNPFLVFGNMPPREGLAEREDYPWFYQEPAKPKIKTATVSVPRSSDSDTTTQSSSTGEQRSEAIPDDAFSLTPDTSRSSCVNNYDSFHQLSPSNSTASSFTGLHECLAPGFLRAAAGDVHVRSFGMAEEDLPEAEDAATNLFRPVVGNMGLLPAPSRTPDGALQKNIDRQYPDLSTIAERDPPLVFPTSLPKASRVVGHGRPGRSGAGETDSNHAAQTSGYSVSSFDVTSAAGDGAGAGTATCGNTSATCEPTPARSLPTPAERPESPEVMFPESLREDDSSSERSKPVDVFPSIHDMNERDLFQDVFSNSFFLEQIAIDQIRRRFRAMGGGEEVLRNQSILFHDLDYYASLYGVRLRDILGPLVEVKAPRTERVVTRKSLDQSVPGWKALVKELGRKMNSKEDLTEAGGDLDLPCDSEDPAISDWPWRCKMTPPTIVSGGDGEGEEAWWQEGGGSRRWRTWLRQILDMPWTMRRQYGKIVMPARSMEFNIGRTGRHPLILGFLTDGTEVGVLALDRTRHALDTRLMATVAADSEPDVHFVLRYKAVWECAGRVYVAMELCDYTLDEYVGIVRLDHRQDPLSANRLAWQLLKGLKYLHSNFAVPHGNLMPGWIFVDCDGRLRLAGYGLRDVTAPRSANRDVPDRSTLEGDGRYWRATEHTQTSSVEPSFQADIQVAGMLLHYILTGGRHPYGDSGPEVEANLNRNTMRQHRVSQEADHLVSLMTVSDPLARPSVDTCLKHPFFWSGEKRFRLVLIVGSDILTEMKTGVPLTGAGSASMVDILNVIHINTVSDNWLSEVDPVLVKEMRAFRQYKNNLPELVLFVYNCCLHFDKMSTVAKEVLDDPCRYFQSRFSGLFMAVYRAMKSSDRTDRTCYKPFF